MIHRLMPSFSLSTRNLVGWWCNCVYRFVRESFLTTSSLPLIWPSHFPSGINWRKATCFLGNNPCIVENRALFLYGFKVKLTAYSLIVTQYFWLQQRGAIYDWTKVLYSSTAVKSHRMIQTRWLARNIIVSFFIFYCTGQWPTLLG